MKTLITAVMLSVIATAGFAETTVETANKVITKGKFVTRLGDWYFVMAYKGKAYTCSTEGRYRVVCVENPDK